MKVLNKKQEQLEIKRARRKALV